MGTREISYESCCTNKKILAVDDDKTMLAIYEHIIKKNDWIFIGASSGEEALKLIAEDRPDIILLDVIMEGITGIEVCSKLKNNPKYTDIPTIIITGLGEEKQNIMALESGADDFITKPVSKKILTAKIMSLLKNKYILEKANKADKLQLFYATVVTANHNINQPLFVIKGTSEILEKDLARLNIFDVKIAKHVESIKGSADEINSIMGKLRSITDPMLEEYVDDVKMVNLDKGKKSST